MSDMCSCYVSRDNVSLQLVVSYVRFVDECDVIYNRGCDFLCFFCNDVDMCALFVTLCVFLFSLLFVEMLHVLTNHKCINVYGACSDVVYVVLRMWEFAVLMDVC